MTLNDGALGVAKDLVIGFSFFFFVTDDNYVDDIIIMYSE